MKNFINYFIKHSVITNWVMLVICFAGIFALANMKKRVEPKFEIEEINIQVPFPGASAKEVEEGIVIKIEESIRSLSGIDRITSTSSDNYGSVNVEINPDYDISKALQEIKNYVNSINSYPTGAEKPVIYQQTAWNRAVMLSIHGPDDLVTLKKVVEEFRDELLATGKITEINYWGVPSREISIEVSPENLIRYKLTVDEIAQAVRNFNLNISSGSVLTKQEQILIRSYNKKYEASELENIEIVSSIDGQKVKLTDVCTIKEQWPDNMFFSEYNGKASVGFNVMYNNNEDVVEVVEITEQMAEKFREKYAGLVEFNTFIKQTDELEERIDLMTQNGLIGLGLVLILLSIFLNTRLSIWVALGIPISLLGMFFVLWIWDITINEMSLFGIIMVIGILVDDGIIIGESIYSQFEKYGKKPVQAAIDGTLEVIKPVAISILTTCVAFVPYFYFYGGLGKFVWQIAAVIITALLFSLIEAIIILPAHLAHSKAMQIKPKSNNIFSRFRESLDNFINNFINNTYSKIIKFSLRNRWAVSTLMFAVILIIAGLFQGSHVRAQFFPELEPPYARIQVDVPAGMSSEIASAIRGKLIKKALAFGKEWEEEKNILNPIQNYTSWMNGGTINIFFVLPTADKRDYSIGDFSNALRDYVGDVPEAENVMIGGWSFGGDPISVKLQSQDYAQLMRAKELLKEELKSIDGVNSIQDDTPIGNNEFIVELKPKGMALGFTLRDLTTQLRQGFYGQEVMRLQRGRDEVKIWIRFDKSNRVSIAQIENLKVRTPQGSYVQFKEVADYKIERGLRRIRHEDGNRSIRVYAKFDYEKNDLAVVMKDLDGEIIPRVLSQVEGVRRSFGGQSEEMAKIMNSMTYSMSIALLVMFTILMFLLKSYWQTLLIMSLIPLGIIGAVFGHYLVGIPVSILSFLGIVALAGIIINDSVVLIDKYNRMIKDGVEIYEALYQASITRFRPIVLTTITTAAGLAPIIMLRSEQGQFLVPMAVSIAFGLLFGTFITLIVLPAALYSISDIRLLFRKKKSREELEPAYSGD
ncbi:MAG: efflux RND transporter permease subunit [Melioribacteraceae bacterium]|nr:efflux RND transporter permease subunit [Melioribacteraceae bacterium]